MKKIILLAALIIGGNLLSQNGTSRAEAIPVTPQNSCTYSNFTTQGLETWYKFTAQSQKVAVELKSEKFGNNQAHVHHVKLYKAMETVELNYDELPFNAESEKLKINLNAGNLTVGETYYIKAERKPHLDNCNKNSCTQNNFATPANFKLCVENVHPYIPNDYYGESPTMQNAFELNRGQVGDFNGQVVNDIIMYSKKSNPQLYLGGHSTSFIWTDIDNDESTNTQVHRVDMELVNGHLDENILKSEELKGHTNYYVACNPKGILANKSYSRAIRQNIYNGIDLQYYSNGKGLKMYFVVYENANHNDIKFKFTGGATSELTTSGGLKVTSQIGGEMVYKKAIVYSVNPAGNNVIMPQSGKIIDLGNNTYTVEVIETYPSNRKLIIQIEKDGPTRDESDIEWSTFFSGANDDEIYDIAAGSDERFYVTGVSRGANFPIFGPNVYDGSFSGTGYFDAFFAQFNNQYELEYSTFLGGENSDDAYGISHDDVNNVTYIIGSSDSDASTLVPIPFAPNPNSYFDQLTSNEPDANNFIARFNSVGVLTWLSFLPGNNTTWAKVAVDNSGNVFCARRAFEPVGQPSSFSCNALPNGGLPLCRTNPNAYLQEFSGVAINEFNADISIMKFSTNLDLTWSTYFGGEDIEFLADIEIDENNVYFVGSSNSQSCIGCYPDNVSKKFPVRDVGGYFQENAYNTDGFIAKFTLDGELVYSSFFGGELSDNITDAALFNGKLFVGGFTHTNYYHNVEGEPSNGGGFPRRVFGNSNQDNYGGGLTDNFIAEFRALTQLLTWSTFVGGAGQENGSSGGGGMKVDVNELGHVFVSGVTASGSNNSNGTISPVYNSSFYSNDTHSDYSASGPLEYDIFVKGYDANRSNFWTTYFGTKIATIGVGSDVVTGIQTIKEKVFLTGKVSSPTNFPYKCPATVNPYCQPDFRGENDAFLAQLKLGPNFFTDLSEYTLNEERIKIYPNPTNDLFIIETYKNYSEIQNIEIKNQLGQIVKELKNPKKNEQNSYEINISDLINGIYFVTLSENEQRTTVKIVKN